MENKTEKIKYKSVKITQDTYFNIKKIINILEAENGYTKNITLDNIIKNSLLSKYKEELGILK